MHSDLTQLHKVTTSDSNAFQVQSRFLLKWIRLSMIDGKKTKAYSMITTVLKTLAEQESHKKPIEFVLQAIDNVKPILEVRKRRIAGSTQYVPCIVPPKRQESLALRWLMEAARKRRITKKKQFTLCLIEELVDAFNKRGVVRHKRDELHKLAEANRGFSHYRWW
jgi:small subunit ribosomal protein S7